MTLNLAFYGTGDQAQPYLKALARRGDVNLTAVCDLDLRAAEQVAAGWRARVFPSYQAMLEEVRPDALWVCVEPHLQGDILLQAAEQKIPFFVEPPGAADYQRARLYDRRVRENEVIAAVGFPAWYTDVILEAREYLGTNAVPLALGWWLCRPGERTPKAAADLLWTDACRMVDLCRFFCGDVVRVRALSAGDPGGLMAQLEFTNGTVGVLTCTTFARPESRVELELLGDGWSLVFGDDLKTLRLAEHDKTTIIRCQNDPCADAAAAFLDAVTAGTLGTLPTSYGQVLGTLAVCQAAAVSAKEGRPVDLTELAATERSEEAAP